MNTPLRNFSALALAEIASKGIGFVTTVFLARMLGVEGFGIIGFAAVFYGYAVLIANPGFDTVGTREIAKGDHSPQDIIGTVFLLRAGLSLAAFLILAAVAALSQFPQTVRMLIIVQGCNLFVVPFMMQFYFRGTKDMAIVAVSRILQSVVYLALILAFVRSGDDILRVPMSFVASHIAALLPLLAKLSGSIPSRSFTIAGAPIKYIAMSSLRVGAASLVVQTYVSFDTLLLGYFRTVHEVGLYTAAYKIITMLTIIPALLFQTYLPHLTQESVSGTGNDWLRQFRTVTIAAGVCIGALAFVLAPWIITLAYGVMYRDAVLPLQILSGAVVVIYCNVALANPLLARGKDNLYLTIVASGAVVNLTANLVLIPRYGIVAAAVTTLLAEVVVLGMTLLTTRKLFGPHSTFVQP